MVSIPDIFLPHVRLTLVFLTVYIVCFSHFSVTFIQIFSGSIFTMVVLVLILIKIVKEKPIYSQHF